LSFTAYFELMLTYAGLAEVRVGDRFRANLGSGDFVGEMSFSTGRPTSANVEVTSDALQPATYLTWRREDLLQLFKPQPGIKDALQAILGVDMAQKLSR